MIISYLAGPIDYADDKGKGWKDQLLSMCAGHKDLGFFDPYGPFKFEGTSHEMARYIHDINMFALEKADILVGSLKKGQTSVGTPIEFYHVLNKKPMLILTDLHESIYMKYLGSFQSVEFFQDINRLYGKLLGLAKEIQDYRAKQLTGPNPGATISALRG